MDYQVLLEMRESPPIFLFHDVSVKPYQLYLLLAPSHPKIS